MNTSEPQISKYDEIMMNRGKFASLIKIIGQLVDTGSIDIRDNGQPDIVEVVPQIEAKKVVVRFNCAGNLATLYAPLGGRSKDGHIEWNGGGPGQAKRHIIEPSDHPPPVKETPPGGERGRRVLDDDAAARGDIDYRSLARDVIK